MSQVQGPGTDGTGTGNDNSTDVKGTKNAAAEEEASLCHGIVLNQQSENAYLNPNWVLLNSESMDHIFCSDQLVTDIVSVMNGEFLRLHLSGGHLDTHQKGRFGGFTI